MTNQYDNVPQELKDMPRWVCYGENKMPINARTGGGAMSNNATTWSSFEEAANAVSHYCAKGIGFMLGGGIFGIDIDKCIDIATGELSEEAADIVETVRSYSETSPSGTGIHILCKGTLPKGSRRKNGIEMYDSERYFTVTGAIFGSESRLMECTAEAAVIHEKYLGQKKEPTKQEIGPRPIDLSDNEIINAAYSSKDGARFKSLFAGDWQLFYKSHSEADLGFANMLSFWFGADKLRMDNIFRSSGLYRPKWDETRGGKSYGIITLDKAISECVEVYTPKPKVEAFEDAAEFFKNQTSRVEVTPIKKQYSLDDTGNAQRFKDFSQDCIKYDHSERTWYIWDGTRWKVDDTENIKRLADSMLAEMEKSIFGMQDREAITAFKAHMRRSKSSKGKQAFIVETQHLGSVPALPSDFDNHKGLFNVRNGTIKLSRGDLCEHKKSDRLTKLSSIVFDKAAECPLWLKFLEDITSGDIELIEYLQCIVGYCLCGSTKEQCMFFLYGSGANGKSTFLEIVRELMGEYAMNTQADTLMSRERANGSARSDIARLRGARLVTTSESEEGAALNESLVKQLTGGDAITSRFLYGKDFEYRPEFKILMATNHKPKIKGTDDGIWRRVRLIPFEVSIAPNKQDRNLLSKLKQELSGILNWAVEGTVKWQKNSMGTTSGLPKCKAVDMAIEEYKTEMDRLSQFIDECIVNEEGKTLQASSFYKMYTSWAKENGEKFPFTAQRFGREMQKKYKTRRASAGMEYLSVGATSDGLRHMCWGTGAGEDFYKTMAALKKQEKPVEQMTLPRR